MTNKNKVEVIGEITEKIASDLELELAVGTEILCGDTNKEHMKNSHPKDYEKYGHKIEEIIKNPDYVGKHPGNGSLQYIKKYEEHVLVAVRVTSNQKLFARSLYSITGGKFNSYLESGTLFKITED